MHLYESNVILVSKCKDMEENFAPILNWSISSHRHNIMEDDAGFSGRSPSVITLKPAIYGKKCRLSKTQNRAKEKLENDMGMQEKGMQWEMGSKYETDSLGFVHFKLHTEQYNI